VDPEAFVAAIRGDTVLAAVMLVQNEIGSVEPVAEIGRRLRDKGASCLFHVDAVQALGKMPLSVGEIGCDTMALSGHKIHGPKGVGALYVREGVRLGPLYGGGKQERGLRPGTENVPGCVGFGIAAELATHDLEHTVRRMTELRDRLIQGVLACDLGATLLGPPPKGARCATFATFAFPHIPAEVLVHALEARGVYVSSGSACGSRRKTRSHVLDAIHVPRHMEAIRMTLSRETLPEDVEIAVEALREAVREIRP